MKSSNESIEKARAQLSDATKRSEREEARLGKARADVDELAERLAELDPDSPNFDDMHRAKLLAEAKAASLEVIARRAAEAQAEARQLLAVAERRQLEAIATEAIEASTKARTAARAELEALAVNVREIAAAIDLADKAALEACAAAPALKVEMNKLAAKEKLGEALVAELLHVGLVASAFAPPGYDHAPGTVAAVVIRRKVPLTLNRYGFA